VDSLDEFMQQMIDAGSPPEPVSLLVIASNNACLIN